MLWKCISGGLILKIFRRTPGPPILYHTSCKRSAKGYAMVLVQVLHPATHNSVPCYALLLWDPCLCTFWIFWRGNIHCKHNQILKYNNKGDCYVWFYRSVPLRSRYVVFVSAAQIRIGRACRNSSSRVRTVETAVSSVLHQEQQATCSNMLPILPHFLCFYSLDVIEAFKSIYYCQWD